MSYETYDPCVTKKRFESKADAKGNARRYKGRGFGRGRPYRCPTCDQWHLTTVDAASRTELRKRDRDRKGRP